MVSSASNNKKVHFGSVTIREYPIILGDNPGGSTLGAPIQIDWKPVDEVKYGNMELREHFKEQNNINSTPKSRRNKRSLVISSEKRIHMLLRQGYTMDQIADATVQVQRTQQERSESMQDSPGWDGVKIILETTGKLPRGILTATGGTLKFASTLPKELLGASGRILKKGAKPLRNSFRAVGA